MVITKFKSKAKFGKVGNFVAKLNFSILEIRDRRGRTNGKWSNYELKNCLFEIIETCCEFRFTPQMEVRLILLKGMSRINGERKSCFLMPTILIIFYYGTLKHFTHGSIILSLISLKILCRRAAEELLKAIRF